LTHSPHCRGTAAICAILPLRPFRRKTRIRHSPHSYHNVIPFPPSGRPIVSAPSCAQGSTLTLAIARGHPGRRGDCRPKEARFALSRPRGPPRASGSRAATRTPSMALRSGPVASASANLRQELMPRWEGAPAAAERGRDRGRNAFCCGDSKTAAAWRKTPDAFL
jgi:hypothetical protein